MRHFFLGGGVIYNVIYRNFDFAVGGGGMDPPDPLSRSGHVQGYCAKIIYRTF